MGRISPECLRNMILEVKDISMRYPLYRGLLRIQTGWLDVLNDIKFEVYTGETLAIVGESGCGKTTLAKIIMGLIKPTQGSVIFNGEDILKTSKSSNQQWRKDIQIVFQDPFGSLNPGMKIFDIIAEPSFVQKTAKGYELKEKVESIIKIVGLSPDSLNRYPHKFSGGQRQRVGIARALILSPKILIFDEPVSNLDVSIQAQILNLIMDLQDKFKTTYIFISHDLRVVETVSDRILVMFKGRTMEIATNDIIFKEPAHPYTAEIMNASYGKTLDLKTSEVHPTNGCSFYPGCRVALPRCRVEEPRLVEIKKEHMVACLRF